MEFKLDCEWICWIWWPFKILCSWIIGVAIVASWGPHVVVSTLCCKICRDDVCCKSCLWFGWEVVEITWWIGVEIVCWPIGGDVRCTIICWGNVCDAGKCKIWGFWESLPGGKVTCNVTKPLQVELPLTTDVSVPIVATGTVVDEIGELVFAVVLE